MTPGTWYVAEHIFTCLLAALLFGGILGWLLYSWLRQSNWSGLQADWTQRLNLATDEKDQLARQLKVSTDTLTDWRTKYAALESQFQTAEANLADCGKKLPALEVAVADWTAKSAAWDSERTKLQADLKTCAGARAKLESEVADWAAQGRAWDKQRITIAGNLASAGDEKIRLQAGMAALHSEHTLLKSNFADAQSKLGPLEGMVAGWVAKSHTWDSDRNRLLEELHQATGVVVKRDAELKDLRLKLSALEQEKTRHETNGTDLRARINSLQAQLQKVIADRKAPAAVQENEWKARYSALEAEHNQCAPRYAALEQIVTEKMAPAPLTMAASASASPSRSSIGKPTVGDIENIEGIGPVYGGELRKIGIHWIRELLEKGKTPSGRARIAAETGIDHRLILKWVHHADLLRIEGVTPNWAELLEASGCESVDELHQRVPSHLQQKMEEINPSNGSGKYAPTVPGVDTVSQWREQAKKLEPKITY